MVCPRRRAPHGRLHQGGSGVKYTITGTTESTPRMFSACRSPKVVIVQKPDEKDQIRQLKRQVAELQRVLGQTQTENVLNAEFLKIACEELDCDVEAFKKKVDTTPSTELPNSPS